MGKFARTTWSQIVPKPRKSCKHCPHWKTIGSVWQLSDFVRAWLQPCRKCLRFTPASAAEGRFFKLRQRLESPVCLKHPTLPDSAELERLSRISFSGP